MHTSSVRVLRGPITVGGWRARLIVDGDTLTIDGSVTGRSLVVSRPSS